jgi:hypothetical protein
MREEREVYKVLVGKLEKKDWEDGIRMDLKETGWGRGLWSGFSWLRTGTGG